MGAGLQWIQLNESGFLLVAGFADHVSGFSTAGNLTPVFRLPIGNSTDRCLIQSENQTICIALHDCAPRLSLWNFASAKKIDEVLIPDRDGAGYCLVPHPEDQALAVVGYSGNSEEWMYWAHLANNKLRLFHKPVLEDVAFPCFHPSGREFVSYYERCGLCRGSFPSAELLATASPEVAFPDNPEDTYSYDFHFFRNDRFLGWQTNLALYEFDLETLTPTAKVLKGVDGLEFGEDRLFSKQSWQLAGCRLLTSESHYDVGFKNVRYTLRLWDAAALSGEFAQPDPTASLTAQLLASAGD